MKNILFLLLLCLPALAATTNRTSLGQITINAPSSANPIFGSPLIGMSDGEFLPVATDSSGAIQVASGGGGPGSVVVDRTTLGQITITTPGKNPIFAYPLIGLDGDDFVPVAVDVNGHIIVSGGGGGGSGTVTGVSSTLPIYMSGNTSVTPNVNILQSSATSDGYITSSDWNKINAGSTSHFTGYNTSGVLDSVTGWNWDSFGRASIYTPIDVTAEGSFTNLNYEFPTEQTASTNININSFSIDAHLDRNHTDTDFSGSYSGLNSSVRAEGAGHVNNISGANISAQIGNGNGGTSDGIVGMNLNTSVTTGTSVGFAGGLNVSIDATSATVDGANGLNIFTTGYFNNILNSVNVQSQGSIGNGYYAFNSYNQASVVGNSSLINSGNNGAMAQGLNMVNLFNQSGGTISGDFRGVNLSNDAPILNNSAGFQFFNQAPIAKSFSGYYVSSNRDMGDGTSNFNGFSFDLAGSTLSGGTTAFRFNTDSKTLGNFNVEGMDINTGTHSGGFGFFGVSINQQANWSEAIQGLSFNSTGNSRTQTGININMQGHVTDDIQGLRINVNSMTSDTQHVVALSSQGGVNNFQGDFAPFSGNNVEIGNGFSLTSTIAAGTTLTGTDQILQLIQSNLLVQGGLTTGPFGLDTNMIGMVSQIDVEPGNTVPYLRSLLVGTSVPAGSGGTITETAAIEFIGLPSFGGSVANPTRVGIQDSTLLGSTLCGGANPATNCWGIRVRDNTADNHLGKLSINTSSMKTSPNVRLEVQDGHLRLSQSTAPVSVVDANAGTGATCTLTGATDSAGTIEIVTGSGSWAPGPQCLITFNAAYGGAPKCVFSAVNASAAAATLGVYLTASNANFSMDFVTADSAATTYQWDYYCVEAN